VKRLCEAIESGWAEKQVQSGLSSGEGLIYAVRDPVIHEEKVLDGEGEPTGDIKEVVVDPGASDKRLLVLESEFASPLKMISREGNTVSAVVRQAWDSGDLRTLTKNSPLRSTGAHISMIGHVTQGELLRYLSTTEAGNGFANRFLWVCVRRSKILPEGGRIDEVDFTATIQAIGEAATFAKNIDEMKRDEDAREIWLRVYGELSEGRPGLLGAAISRAEAQVMRLAIMYAILDCSIVVCKQHLLAALAVWDYCEASARFIFGETLGDPVADELLRFLRASPLGRTRTEIRDFFGRNSRAGEIDRALVMLSELKLAYATQEKTNGRPVERWFATPRSTT
jgi:hypothetical protein